MDSKPRVYHVGRYRWSATIRTSFIRGRHPQRPSWTTRHQTRSILYYLFDRISPHCSISDRIPVPRSQNQYRSQPLWVSVHSLDLRMLTPPGPATMLPSTMPTPKSYIPGSNPHQRIRAQHQLFRLGHITKTQSAIHHLPKLQHHSPLQVCRLPRPQVAPDQ
jgi:hypothetical protein